MIDWKHYFIVSVLIMSVPLSCSCKTVEPLEPEPIAAVDELVTKSVNQWLDVRIETEDIPALKTSAALADRLTALENVLSTHTGFDFNLVINDIKTSQLYIDNPIDDIALYLLIGEAVQNYTSEE